MIENLDKFGEYEVRKEYYFESQKNLYTYDKLFKDTILDIDKKISHSHKITLL